MSEYYEEENEYTDEYEEAQGMARLLELMMLDNVADVLDDNELRDIGSKAVEEYEEDLESLDEWFETNDEALKLAKQVRETKTFPWTNASNVKFPLISQAAMQFNARAYPEIVQGDKVVKAKVIGADPQELKADRAERISEHMNYQLTREIPNWEADTDKLLMMLPIVGTMFREVCWNEIELRPEITLLMPDELIVNYNAKSVELSDCRRITKEFILFSNDIMEREDAGIWREIQYSKGSIEGDQEEDEVAEDQQSFIQQCRYIDLDGDGYEEPWIVTVHKDSGQVVRIIPCFDSKGIQSTEDYRIIRINPFKLYSDYHFVPAFDGAFYSTGFGHYLYPLNSSIDTIINQLIDAGTLANTQAGYLAKGLRTRTGSKTFKPGEWKPVDTKGMDLRNSIMPLPTKEPSMVLFNLLQALIGIGKEMTSITDVLSGVPTGANVPVGTTTMMIEQGMKVMDAIYKRIYRAFSAEFNMLYRINGMYLDDAIYQEVLDQEAEGAADYNQDDFDVFPVGDTRISSQAMRTMKAQSALELAQVTPGADIRAASMRVLEAMDIPNPEEILPEGPSVEELQQQLMMAGQQMQVMQAQMQAIIGQFDQNDERRKDMEIMLKAKETEIKEAQAQSKIATDMAAVSEKLQDIENKQVESELRVIEALNDATAALNTPAS